MGRFGSAQRTLTTVEISRAVNLSPKTWKAFPLVSKTWGGEWIVFNKASGNTHLVNSTAAKMLAIVQSQAISAEEISHKIATEMEVDADNEILQQVKVVLATLEGLGLIESFPQ